MRALITMKIIKYKKNVCFFNTHLYFKLRKNELKTDTIKQKIQKSTYVGNNFEDAHLYTILETQLIHNFLTSYRIYTYVNIFQGWKMTKKVTLL